VVCIKVQRVQEESKQKYGYNLSGIHPLQPEGIVSLAGKNMIPFAHRPRAAPRGKSLRRYLPNLLNLEIQKRKLGMSTSNVDISTSNDFEEF